MGPDGAPRGTPNPHRSDGGVGGDVGHGGGGGGGWPQGGRSSPSGVPAATGLGGVGMVHHPDPRYPSPGGPAPGRATPGGRGTPGVAEGGHGAARPGARVSPIPRRGSLSSSGSDTDSEDGGRLAGGGGGGGGSGGGGGAGFGPAGPFSGPPDSDSDSTLSLEVREGPRRARRQRRTGHDGGGEGSWARGAPPVPPEAEGGDGGGFRAARDARPLHGTQPRAWAQGEDYRRWLPREVEDPYYVSNKECVCVCTCVCLCVLCWWGCVLLGTAPLPVSAARQWLPISAP
jgi:hypothetical protein